MALDVAPSPLVQLLWNNTVTGGVYTTVMYGRWLVARFLLLAKYRNRSRSFEGSEFNRRPKFAEGLANQAWTRDVTSHCLNPGVLSTALLSTAGPISALGQGTPL